jgi:hypothetical protein
MATTRKNRSSGTRKQRIPRHEATMPGLVMWHKSMFERLGWMVLAKAKGMTQKVKAYKVSVNDLVKSIEHVMKEYEDHNRKHDLKVLLMQARFLRDKANRIL